MSDVQTVFKRRFGYPPAHIVRVPVWLELLGSATVDPQGLALSVAVDQYVDIASAPRADGKVELISPSGTEPALFWMSQLEPTGGPTWSECLKSILHDLRRRGVHFTGFTAAVSPEPAIGRFSEHTDFPAYAALQVATALTIRHLHPFRLTETGATVPPRRNSKGELPQLEATEKTSIARLCLEARPKHPGTNASLLGPLTCLFGKAWHVLSVDLQSLAVEHLPFTGEVFVRCELPSSPPANSSGPEPEFENRAYALSATRKLRAKSLRAVEIKSVETNKTRLTPREYECARHFTTEGQRLIAAERALRAEEHRQFGQYLLDSHRSARKLSQNGAPDLDLLVDLAVAHPGCLGAVARHSAALAVVNFHQVENFMTQVSDQFQKQTGRTSTLTLLRSVDGAGG